MKDERRLVEDIYGQKIEQLGDYLVDFLQYLQVDFLQIFLGF